MKLFSGTESRLENLRHIGTFSMDEVTPLVVKTSGHLRCCKIRNSNSIRVMVMGTQQLQ